MMWLIWSWTCWSWQSCINSKVFQLYYFLCQWPYAGRNPTFRHTHPCIMTSFRKSICLPCQHSPHHHCPQFSWWYDLGSGSSNLGTSWDILGQLGTLKIMELVNQRKSRTRNKEIRWNKAILGSQMFIQMCSSGHWILERIWLTCSSVIAWSGPLRVGCCRWGIGEWSMWRGHKHTTIVRLLSPTTLQGESMININKGNSRHASDCHVLRQPEVRGKSSH